MTASELEGLESVQVERRRLNRLAYALGLAGVLALGAGLRLYGIGFGLPQLYHWDEKMYYHGAFYAMATGGNTESLVYGNVPYMLVPVVWLVSGGGDLSSMITRYLDDPTPFYLAGRTLWVGLQVLALWLVCAMGSRWLSRRAGLLGAGFTAVAFLAVSEGHYVKGDSTAMLGAVFAAWSALWLIERPSATSYALLGVAVGLSLSFKLYTFPLVALPVIVHFFAWPGWKQRLSSWPRLLFSLGAGLATFIVTMPAVLVDPAGTWETLQTEAGITLASVDTGGVPVWLYYWTGHLWEGLGWPLELCGLAGLLYWLARRDRNRVILLLIPLLLWLGLITRTNGFARYALPLVPFLALAAGDLLHNGAAALAARWPSRRALVSSGLALLAFLLALPSLINDLRFGAYASAPDTRSIALDWFERSIPDGATVVVEGGQGFEAMSTLGVQMRPARSAVGQSWEPTRLKLPEQFWREPLLNWLDTYTPTYRVVFAPTMTRKVTRENVISTDQWGNPDAFVLISWRSDPERGTPPSPIWADLRAKYGLAARFDCSPCFEDDPYAWEIDYNMLARVNPLSRETVGGPRVWVYTRR